VRFLIGYFFYFDQSILKKYSLAMSNTNKGYYEEFGGIVHHLSSAVSRYVRKKMYELFEKNFSHVKSVIDVGVTSSSSVTEANYFEEFFPHKERITALGVENASHLEKTYPGLKFVQVKENEKWPFPDDTFEVAFCSAVIEHVVADTDRDFFMRELLRVSPKTYITIPYKWFPVEHHTGMPFIHWLPIELFFRILNKIRKDTLYNQFNLSFLDRRKVENLFNAYNVKYKIIPVKFFIFTSNLVVLVERN
jgi:hypothetical protein